MPAVHRNTDSRACGAITNVVGQTTVYVNNQLASVKNDPNSHGAGNLNASVNNGTVFVENKLLVLVGSSAQMDNVYPPTLAPPHLNPSATGGSPNVFACD